MSRLKSLKLLLGSALCALAMLALVMAPGLLSDSASTTTARGPTQAQR